jgi:hypothetical protein
VRKYLAEHDSPGASAAAEGRRARRHAARRRRVSVACATVSAGLLALGEVTGGRWPLGGCVAMAVVAWCCRPPPDPDRWHRGAQGEIATAQLLTRLPRQFVVLHDRRPPGPGPRGNLDHVVIGPSGVWVVDSKVRNARLRIRRGRVWAGDYQIDVAPVARQAARVEELLGVPVVPMVAVHGHGLRRRGKKVDGVRVVPASRAPRRLRRGERLAKEQVNAVAARAEMHLPRCE